MNYRASQLDLIGASSGSMLLLRSERVRPHQKRSGRKSATNCIFTVQRVSGWPSGATGPVRARRMPHPRPGPDGVGLALAGFPGRLTSAHFPAVATRAWQRGT